MTVDELRACFPVLRERAYLFSGGLSPLAEPVRTAHEAMLRRWQDDPAELYATLGEPWQAGRAAFAAVLGAHADEIALTDGTSRGSNLAVQMLDVKPGENVVVDDSTYWSSAVPWRLRARAGTELRRVRARADSCVHVDDLAKAIDDRTAVVSITHVSFRTGVRHDLAAIAELAHAHGALLVVDLAQAAGALALDLPTLGVDIASGLAMKWLLGSPGVGFLFVRRGLIERLEPAQVGYVSLANLWDDDVYDAPRFHDTAARFELAIPDLAAVAASTAGIRLLLETGMETVEERVLDLSGRCLDGLRSRGATPFTPDEPAQRAGVVAVPVADAALIVAGLRARGVDVWCNPAGTLLRIDPHAFNTSDDVDRALAGLAEIAAEAGRSVLERPASAR